MNRLLPNAPFAVGLLVLTWVGAGYGVANPLALALVLLIAAFFVLGAVELQRFRQATDGLRAVLDATDAPPPDLGAWLARLPAPLQNAVQLRVEGDRVALPGPALAPYIAGLLVLLGMLGTFLGMVLTLKGTGLALENAADVDAIRASLAAPVKGLGLAFGCSVAGVAASAMLGLMTALARRDRQQAAQRLDARIAGPLRGFSRVQQSSQQREQALQLLRAQADALPALVTQVQQLVAQVDRQGRALHDGLLAQQAQFHGEAQRAYTGLAESVDRSLQSSLAESARVAGAAIEPAVRNTLAGLSQQTAALQQALGSAVQQQLDGVATRLEHSAGRWAASWHDALDQQRHDQAALLRSVADAHSALETAAATRERERLAAFDDGLRTMATTLERGAETLAARTEAHARATIDEVARLVQVAAEGPRAAADALVELRRALSESLQRDNAVLAERQQLLGTLAGLLDAVNHASTEQRGAIDALVRTTDELLDRVGSRFAERVDAEAQRLHSAAAQVTGGAAEVASLGEGFGVAVQLFSSASEQLMAQLQRIEQALGQSMARSDEQLAYYVAQAREIIDLTLGSQKQIVDDLQQLAHPAQQPRTPAEAAAA